MADFVIHQTDERMFLLREELTGVHPHVTTHVFAPNVLLTAKLVGELNGGECIVGGRADEEALALVNSRGITHFNLLEDERFQAVNARLTAEGTLSVFLAHSLLSIRDVSALVIGFGRSGAAVSRILSDVGVKRLTIATTASVRPAGALADEVISVGKFDFSGYDLVVNTVPQKLISDDSVLTFKPSAVYIDLASTPGLSICFAKYVGIDADVYPALPAKTAPLSAARAIKDYINGVLQ